jgi:hypothetical protein
LLEIKELSESSQNFQVDENKLWDMLNFIERWERTRSDSSKYRETLAELRVIIGNALYKLSGHSFAFNSQSFLRRSGQKSGKRSGKNSEMYRRL